jgi:hypothetical protein
MVLSQAVIKETLKHLLKISATLRDFQGISEVEFLSA